MAVVLMREWDLPKDRARLQRYAEFMSWRGGLAKTYERFIDVLDQLTQANKLRHRVWSDSTGHVVAWSEYEDMESFAKLWSLDEAHKWYLELISLVDNMQVRLLRPVQMITVDVS